MTKLDRFEWGVRDRWIGAAKVPVSDYERTFLDCLHLPRHAGGVTEIAAAFLRAWPTLDQDRLVSHADLTQTLDLDEADRLVGRLPHRRWRGRAVSLDLSLPAGGQIDRRWGVRMNVQPDELSMVGRT